MIQSIELLKSCCRTKKRSSSKTKCYVFLISDEMINPSFCNIKKKLRTKFNSLENYSFNILEWTNTLSTLSSTSFLVYFSRVKAKAATWVCQWTVLNQGNPSSSLDPLFSKPSNGFEGCRYEIDPHLSFCRDRYPIHTYRAVMIAWLPSGYCRTFYQTS